MPTLVLELAVVTVMAIFTVLLPQFLKQSGSESGMWASPPRLSSLSVGPVGGSGNSSDIPVLQAGVQPTLKFRASGVSRVDTASKGSEGTAPSWEPPPNIVLHWLALMKPGRFAHSLSSAPDWVRSTVDRKS